MGHTLEPSLVDKVLKGAKTLCETNGGNGWIPAVPDRFRRYCRLG
jgi:hypothetical protein